MTCLPVLAAFSFPPFRSKAGVEKGKETGVLAPSAIDRGHMTTSEVRFGVYDIGPFSRSSRSYREFRSGPLTPPLLVISHERRPKKSRAIRLGIWMAVGEHDVSYLICIYYLGISHNLGK